MTIRTARDECGSYFDLFQKGAPAHSSCIVVRRCVFREIRPFRVGRNTGQDVDLWFQLALRYELACSPKICSLYYYYLPDDCCHKTKLARVSALCLSCLEMKEGPGISTSVKKESRPICGHASGETGQENTAIGNA